MAKARRKAADAEPPNEAESLRRIASSLDRVARAIVLSAAKDATDAEQALYLNLAGFSPTEIADMYGEKTNVITARISDRRKAREKRPSPKPR